MRHEDEALKDVPETIGVTFVTKDGERVSVMAKEGENALRLAQRNGVEMEGACEASLACTTCHCYVEGGDEFWDKVCVGFELGIQSSRSTFGNYNDSLQLPEATEEEEDLLDMAPFLAENSRLGCQVILTKELEGIELRLPRATKNFYVDGHKPQPH